MAKFEVATPDGRKFEIEAPDAQSASDTLDQYLATQGGQQPAAPQAPAETGYQPSAVPWMDQINSFANSAVDAIPIVGPSLTSAGNQVDAWVNNALGFPEQTAEDRARINASEQAEFPLASGVGTVAGAVGPLTGLGMSSAIAGRALGMTGGLGSQMVLGGLSGAGISGADTLARGGDLGEAGQSAMLGGAVGSLAPLAFKGIGAGIGALAGRGVPKAAQNVARAMQADEITAPGLRRAMAQMGPDATLMDMGPNLQSLAGGIASVRGPGQKVLRDTITSRAKAAPARVAADVGRTIGNGQEIGGLTEQIVAAQKAAADPLYTAVRDVPIKLEGNLKLVASTPLGRQAFKQGIEMAANDGVQPGTLTIGVLDYAKQALDDIASEARRLGKGNANRQAANMARLLASEGDKIAPGYKQAREAFAGPAAVLEAIEEGRATFKADMSPADMQRLMADMTASEKDAFLQGAQTAVADLLGNSANDVAAVRTLLRKPYNEAKLRALIGSEATDDLLRAVDRELMFGQTANAVNSNSETARRTAAQGMVNPDAGPDIGPQGTIGLVFAAINAARGKLRATLQPKVNRDMAELLASKAIDPRALQMLTRAQKSPRALPIAPGTLALPGQDFGNRPPLRIVVDGANPL
jgi:hypothetical protein